MDPIAKGCRNPCLTTTAVVNVAVMEVQVVALVLVIGATSIQRCTALFFLISEEQANLGHQLS